MIDVLPGWSERVPTLGRSYLVVADAFRYIPLRLPFPVRELHPDNGNEFFNHHICRFWRDLLPECLFRLVWSGTERQEVGTACQA